MTLFNFWRQRCLFESLLPTPSLLGHEEKRPVRSQMTNAKDFALPSETCDARTVHGHLWPKLWAWPLKASGESRGA
jgi:hypothetical protein